MVGGAVEEEGEDDVCTTEDTPTSPKLSIFTRSEDQNISEDVEVSQGKRALMVLGYVHSLFGVSSLYSRLASQDTSLMNTRLIGAGSGRRGTGNHVRTSRAEPGRGGRSKGSGTFGQGSNAQKVKGEEIVEREENPEQPIAEPEPEAALNHELAMTRLTVQNLKAAAELIQVQKKTRLELLEDRYRSRFMVPDFPNVKTTFSHAEMPNIEEMSMFDCFGNPFCGLACIDTAAKVSRDYQRYIKLYSDMSEGNAGPEEVVGSSDFLIEYAASLGYNLTIVNIRRRTRVRHVHNKMFDTIFLMHLTEMVFSENIAACEYELGHYVLMVSNVSDDSCSSQLTNYDFRFDSRVWIDIGRPLRYVEYVVKALLRFGIGRFYKEVTFGESFRAGSNWDSRSTIHSRDPLEGQESYRRTNVTMGYKLWPCFNLRLSKEERVVAMARYRTIMEDMQQATDPHSQVKSLAALRGLNLREMPGVIQDTKTVLQAYADNLVCDGVRSDTSTVGLVQFNVPGDAAIIPDAENVRRNQIFGAGGFKKLNHIRKGTVKAGPHKKTIVARAPLGTIITPSGPMTAGAFSLTDSATTVSSFMTRAMPKDYDSVCDKAVAEMVNGSINELWGPILDKTVFSPCVYTGPNSEIIKNFFRKTYSGKRPIAWIEDMCEQYDAYTAGIMSPRSYRKFTQNGYFVKFESNLKWKDFFLYVRPRGIMTMSPLMLMECCPICEGIEEFYCGPVSKYQVKHLSIEEMLRIVEDASRAGCMVTDISAFESSLTSKIRDIEMFVMKKICDRKGIPWVYRNIKKNVGKMFTMKTKWCTFELDTRASGTFWTSAGNGISNISAAWYESKKNGQDFRILAEGDDGLVPKGMVTAEGMGKLGFKFSSSIRGQRPGDVDFLRSLIQDGTRYVSVSRCLNVLWVKTPIVLSRGKQLWLIRMAALSLFHIAPGHPVLSALINMIGRKTKHVRPFKNYKRYLNTWKGCYLGEGGFPDHIEVKEYMRERVEQGATDFPGIPREVQLALEEMFDKEERWEVGRVFDSHPEVMDRVNVGGYLYNKAQTLVDFFRQDGPFTLIGEYQEHNWDGGLEQANGDVYRV